MLINGFLIMQRNRSFSKSAYVEVNRLFNKESLQIDLVSSNDIIRDAA